MSEPSGREVDRGACPPDRVESEVLKKDERKDPVDTDQKMPGKDDGANVCAVRSRQPRPSSPWFLTTVGGLEPPGLTRSMATPPALQPDRAAALAYIDNKRRGGPSLNLAITSTPDGPAKETHYKRFKPQSVFRLPFGRYRRRCSASQQRCCDNQSEVDNKCHQPLDCSYCMSNPMGADAICSTC